ncbi:flagellar export chaperone FliS [Aurantivibrio infirmus]
MNMNNPAHAYSSMQVHTGVSSASPHRLVQMLFEGALERIAQAKGAMLQKQVERKGQLIGKAVDIIGGLQGALEDKGEGNLSANLDALYEYSIRRLLEANRQNDTSLLDEVSGLLHEVKGAWDAIADEVADHA